MDAIPAERETSLAARFAAAQLELTTPYGLANVLQQAKIASSLLREAIFAFSGFASALDVRAAVLRVVPLYGERFSDGAEGLWAMRQAAALRRGNMPERAAGHARGITLQCTITFITAERWSAKSGLAERALWRIAFYDVLSNRRLQARKTHSWAGQAVLLCWFWQSGA